MKSDIQIAQEAEMIPIKEVAEKLGIGEDDLELYGKYKAKLSDELIERVKNQPDGKLILVTAIHVFVPREAPQEAVMPRSFRWKT